MSSARRGSVQESDKLWRGGVQLVVQNGAPGKPIVLLCGWMGSVDKHIAKYADVYSAAGCTVVRCSLPPDAGMKGDKKRIAKCAASALAEVDALAEVERCRREAGRDAPFYLHIFSNNGSWMYQSMLWTIANKPTDESAVVLSQLKGVIFDSCPAYMWLSGGLGAMAMSVPSGLPRQALQTLRSAVLIAHRCRYLAALTAVWMAVKKRWGKVAAIALVFALSKHGETFGLPAQFWKAMMNDPLLMIPRLYIFSKDDHLTDHKKLQELIDHRRSKGQVGLETLSFESSPHCGHLRAHPKEYSETVLRFVGAGSSS